MLGAFLVTSWGALMGSSRSQHLQHAKGEVQAVL